jgi:hypothetical protein
LQSASPSLTYIGSFGDLARPRISGTMLSMRKTTKREFTVIVERDEAGYYVASVAELRGCCTQARSLDTLTKRVCETIVLSFSASCWLGRSTH